MSLKYLIKAIFVPRYTLLQINRYTLMLFIPYLHFVCIIWSFKPWSHIAFAQLNFKIYTSYTVKLLCLLHDYILFPSISTIWSTMTYQREFGCHLLFHCTMFTLFFISSFHWQYYILKKNYSRSIPEIIYFLNFGIISPSLPFSINCRDQSSLSIIIYTTESTLKEKKRLITMLGLAQA